MTLALVPDAEQMVSTYLRERPEVAAIAGDRVYTVFPAQSDKNDPIVLVRRVGGIPPFSTPFVFDEAVLQIDAYAGRKKIAHDLMRTVQAVLVELTGQVRPEGCCSNVSLGLMQEQADETFTPARQRYIADVTVHVRAVPAPIAERSSRSAEEVSAHA